MSTLTDDIVVVAQALVDLITANKSTLGVSNVYYGDQDKLPGPVDCCVETDEKDQDYKGARRVLDIEFTIYILVYSGSVTSTQSNRKSADQTAKKIEDLIHQDAFLGGKLIDCHITKSTSGYAEKSKSIVRANRLTFIGKSRSQLP